MTRIDCRTAATHRLRPEQYIGTFVERRGKDIHVAADEEWNEFLLLDADSAEFLGRRLLQIVQRIRKGGRT